MFANILASAIFFKEKDRFGERGCEAAKRVEDMESQSDADASAAYLL